MNFPEIQNNIERFCAELRQQEEVFSSSTDRGLPLSDAIFCAEDRARNAAFFRAISAVAQQLPRDFVAIDAGAGLGILGFFALLAGARKVLFIEINPQTLHFAKLLSEKLGFEKHRMEFYCADARTFSPAEMPDLFLSETISAGFVTEDFPEIVRNFYSFAAPHAFFLPERFEIFAPELSENIFLESRNFPERKKVSLISDVETISFSMKTILRGEEVLESTASFGNPRVFLRRERHPIFDFTPPLF